MSAGVLDNVISKLNGNKLSVHNANVFAPGMKLQMWSALSGIYRGDATVVNVFPGGTYPGDVLLYEP